MADERSSNSANEGLNHYEPTFREHYTAHLEKLGYGYDRYRDAYRYGFGVAQDERYRDRAWDEIKNEVEERWEQEERAAWGEVEDAVREGWRVVRETESPRTTPTERTQRSEQ